MCTIDFTGSFITGLQSVGIKLDEKGRVPVNDKFATAVPK